MLNTEHAASGLPNPTRLEGEIRFIQPQDQQVLSHIVQEWQQSVYSLAGCLLKCITISWYVHVNVHCKNVQSVNFIQTCIVYLVFQIAYMFVFDSTKHEYEFITIITIGFGESFQS